MKLIKSNQSIDQSINQSLNQINQNRSHQIKSNQSINQSIHINQDINRNQLQLGNLSRHTDGELSSSSIDKSLWQMDNYHYDRRRSTAVKSTRHLFTTACPLQISSWYVRRRPLATITTSAPFLIHSLLGLCLHVQS